MVRNYNWDEQNEQWEDYLSSDGVHEFSSVDPNSWNICSNCDHCSLDKNGVTGICKLDGHSIEYNTACNYNIKKGSSNE